MTHDAPLGPAMGPADDEGLPSTLCSQPGGPSPSPTAKGIPEAAAAPFPDPAPPLAAAMPVDMGCVVLDGGSEVSLVGCTLSGWDGPCVSALIGGCVRLTNASLEVCVGGGLLYQTTWHPHIHGLMMFFVIWEDFAEVWGPENRLCLSPCLRAPVCPKAWRSLALDPGPLPSRAGLLQIACNHLHLPVTFQPTATTSICL